MKPIKPLNSNKLQFLKPALRIVSILLAALLINAVILLMFGKNPLFAYEKLFAGAFGSSYSIARTLRWFTLYLLLGTSAAVAFGGDVFNIGIDGQLYMGAMAAAVVGLFCADLPGIVLYPLCILVGIVAGAFWAMIAGFLNLKFHANMVVITLMMNYVATLFTTYCIHYPLHEHSNTITRMTNEISEKAFLGTLVPGTQLTTALFYAIVVLIVFGIWMNKTSAGFEIKLMGKNKDFARVMGVNLENKTALLMGISGGIAGLAGALEIMGIQHCFMQEFVKGVGFDGLVVTMLAGNSFVLLPFAALFMGVIESGSTALEMFANINRSITDILTGIIIMFVTVQLTLPKFKKKLWTKKERKEEAKHE